jgi:2-polyprenyl-6-methoxyphenol hydroxylase-like FAD-dependent oxidoreductase
MILNGLQKEEYFMKPQVLIVGAGPTGLVLALCLQRLGTACRIIDKNPGPGEASRALVVHARILEHYQQLGLAHKIIEKGMPLTAMIIREGSEDKAKLNIANLGKGLSPFPFALSLPQDVHEKLLVEQLTLEGVHVEWNTELVSFSDDGQRVQAVLRKDGEEESDDFDYVCGCDGAHSTVRKELGLEFVGGTYERLFFVADVETETPEFGLSHMYMCLDDEMFCLYMPVRRPGIKRVVGIIPNELLDRASIAYEDIRPFIEQKLGVKESKVNWFATYRVHHRVSEHFRKGRVFIAGDAGHIHSPAGGQGMNTGIGDAVNLSWKLAAVLRGKADSSILDTYETERIAFARVLVASTDRAFQTMIGRRTSGRLFRTVLMPHVMPFLLGFSAARKGAFKVISQTRIHYRESELSEGTAGKVHGGDRLPWVQTGTGHNFDPLQALDWQLHVYGEADEALRAFASTASMSLHEFAWTPEMEKAGLKRDALYLVRPDGYVALACSEQDTEKVRRHLSPFHIHPFQ